jgi:hypothetical protein
MQIPECVLPDALLVGKERMAVGAALRQVAHVVGADGPERTAHADHRAKIDQDTLEPLRTLEAAMDKAPMKADRMAKAERDEA